MEKDLEQEITALIDFLYEENSEYSLIEDFIFEMSGNKYCFREIKDCVDTIVKHKSEIGACVYQLKNIETNDLLRVYVRENFVRCGSAFTDYYYSYEKPFITECVECFTYKWFEKIL